MAQEKIEMIKKQIKTIIALLIAVIILVGAYFIIKPLIAEKEDEVLTVDKDGDTLGIGGRPYVYDVIPSDRVQSIYVKNSYGEYRFNMDPVAKDFVLEGRETLTFDKEKLSYLYVNTCNMLAMTKVEDANPDTAEYGLPNGKSDTFFTVTEHDGTQHTVYIGSILPTGAAYYCKSADKPHIYVIDTMIESCVLASPAVYITPLIAPPIAQEKRYGIETIKLVRNGELFLELQKSEEDSSVDDGTAISHVMTYPGGYSASQIVTDSILTKLVSFVGTSVVEHEIPVEDMEEILTRYGLINPSAELIYTLEGKEYRILFGSKTEDGSAYYVLNLSQQTICTVAAADIPFMEYDLIKFIDDYIFQMDINNVKSIKVTTKQHSEEFELSGEKADLVVTRKSNGEVVDTRNFRQFYIDVLLVNLEDYADAPAEPNEILSYVIETRSGKKHEYRFYDLSTRKVFFTVGGVGQFYANRDTVEKVINNFDKLLKGEEVVSEALS